TELPRDGLDAAVIEVSSYQAADFSGLCDIAVLTSLSQEHLDWHGSIEAYQRDKLNLLHHAGSVVANPDACCALTGVSNVTFFEPRVALSPANAYLMRPHNLSNLSAALTVMRLLGIDTTKALQQAKTFQPLPHRQQEIGQADGVLYVDDSIATTPE